MPRQPLSMALLLIVAVSRPAAAEPKASSPDRTAARVRDDAAELTSGQIGGAKTGESARAVPRNPRVLFIIARNCERCESELARLRRPGGDFDAMRARGWKIGETADNHLQIVDGEAVPELVEELAVREFPTVACVSHGEIVRSFTEGCTTPLDAWTFGWLLKGENERPRGSIAEAARVKTTGSYPLRGNHWSVEGDWNPAQEKVISHLRGPNHVSQLAASWNIDAWSYEELRSLHDDLHERELASGTVTASSASFPVQSPPASTGSQFSASRKILGR